MYYKKPSVLKRPFFLIVFFIFLSASVVSQSYNKTSSFRSYWQINANGGTSLFFGDIKQYQFAPVSNYENEWRFGGGLMLVKQVSPVIGIRGQFLYGKLAGTRRSSNLFFEANYIEFNLNTSLSVRNIIQKYKAKQIWDAYVILGMGLTNFNTELKDLTTKKVVKKVGYGSGKSFGGRTLQGMLFGGLGLDFRLSDRLNVNLETANRVLNTDELDGRTSGFKYDVYNYTSFGISYKFGGRSYSSKEKKNEDYSYFKPQKKDNTISQTEYDYDYSKPLEPPKVDALVIEPTIVTIPVIPPVKDKIIEEIPVEVQVFEKVVVVPEFEYRVQIRAKYGNKISRQHLSNTYNIPLNEIMENSYNGFYIYTIGSFDSYDQAREKRNYIRNYKGISDAFVVAFRNGQRLNKLPQQ